MRLLLTLATLATLAALTGASPTLAAQIDDRGAIAIAKPAGRLGRFDTAPTPAAANLLLTNPSFSTTRKREWRATSECAIAAKCRRFSDATHQAAIAMTQRELNAVSERRETGKVEVHCDEGVAIHIGPEPCVHVRESMGEASAGERIGQPLPGVRQCPLPGETRKNYARLEYFAV